MIIIRTSVPTEKDAHTIAERMVEARLASCAQFHQVRSVFRWQGSVQFESEFLVEIKTVPYLIDIIINEVKGIHPYELPVIEHFEVHANPEAEEWNSTETSSPIRKD